MNGIIIINKEKDYTSRDVVNKLCHILHTKKIGHTGTLDPIATGVLVCVIGKYTKLCELLTSEYKEYIATMKLGFLTDTLDTTGRIVLEKGYNVNEENIKEVLKSFIGKSIQSVPKYSAIKVNGKKLYEYARNNENIEIPKREIDIKGIELIDFNQNIIKFKCLVSKGTYIRSLIRDIGYKLNTVATMSDLIRTKQGKFNIENSYKLDDIENNNFKMLDIEEVLDLDVYELTKEEYELVKNGNKINKHLKKLTLLKYNNKNIAIYENIDNYSKPLIMFDDRD